MKINSDNTATFLGLLTTIVTTAEFIDFDALDYTKINTWVKLLVVIAPAIGGYISSVKPNK